MKFADHIGADVIFVLERLPRKLNRAKLVGVEPGGIWIESQEVTEHLLSKAGRATNPTTPTIFLPFSQLVYVLVQADKVALSEKALRL